MYQVAKAILGLSLGITSFVRTVGDVSYVYKKFKSLNFGPAQVPCAQAKTLAKVLNFETLEFCL